MSVDAPSRTPLIALVGNPNAGKTSLFNALTGLHQKVGNYPGVTVEKHEGFFEVSGQRFDIVDVPGLYSLIPMSEDEQIAVETIKSDPMPDAFLCVVDAANLERNIYFYAQIAQLGRPVVVALTMTDLLSRSGVELDLPKLNEALGVKIVPVIAHKKQGLGSLKFEISAALAADHPGYAALPAPADRYEWAERVAKEVLTANPTGPIRLGTDRIDGILTHRVWGMAVFLGLMYLMFQAIYTLSAPLMDGIDGAFGWLKSQAEPAFAFNPAIQSLVTEGIIGGIGSVAIFLPQILILFGFIAALEGTGYLARASFLMDRALGWCGLNGKAFIPLLSSFACAIPGIMATRIMPDPRSRLATILISPLMSCSARLPVYVLLIGAIIEPRFGPAVAGLTLFGMHILGLLVAVAVMLVLNRRLLRGGRLPFLMELPPYQWPRWKDVLRAMVSRAKVFLQTAGTIIVALSIVIWALLYFPRSPEADARYAAEHASRGIQSSVDNYVDERRLEESYLGQFGRGIEPIFRPAGFDWRISTAIVAAFPAREVMISTLGIIFGLGGDVDEGSTDLRSSLQNAQSRDGTKILDPWTAFGLMVFFALCAQCMSTLAIIKRETNSWKWPVFVFVYMTALAWLGAVAVHQLGRLFAV